MLVVNKSLGFVWAIHSGSGTWFGSFSVGPPVVPFSPFLGERSPTKIDYRKKGTLMLTSLLEDLAQFLAANHSNKATDSDCPSGSTNLFNYSIQQHQKEAHSIVLIVLC